MKLTVLGAYGPYPPAGGACSGYLLEHAGFSVLIDCGNGVLSRLQQFIELGELGAIIVSHLHSDHLSDLFIIRYALLFKPGKGESERPLPVYAPAEPAEEYVRLPYENVYAVEALAEELELRLGPFTFTFLRTQHSIPCFAMAVYLAGAKKLIYSADTEYFPLMADFARGADLFLCESNYLEKDLARGAGNHLSARQAASLAREAGVGTLLLTHLLPFRDPQLYLQEASRVFKNVEIAQEGMVYELGDPAYALDRHGDDEPIAPGRAPETGPDRQVADDATGPDHLPANDAVGENRPAPGPVDQQAVDDVAEQGRPLDGQGEDGLQAGDGGKAAGTDSGCPAADTPVGESSPAKWLQLTVETDNIIASILAGRLEEEGIPVYLKKDEAAGSIYGLTVGPLANIRIFVPPAKIEQARRLLDEIEKG